MQTPLISVIVPVYNAGSFFEKCMNTLVSQTLKEIEIILVLDRPTDGTDQKAREYAAQYENIVLLENEVSLHIGYSRNRGIEMARGEYIAFSDHDDFRTLTMYEEMYHAAKEVEAVVLSTPIQIIHSGDKLENNQKLPVLKHGMEVTIDAFMQLLTDAPNANISIYSRIFKRDFIYQQGIRFVDTSIISAEDVIFNALVFSALLRNNAMTASIDKVYYYHIQHATNAGNKYAYRQVNASVHYLEQLSKIINSTPHISADLLHRLFANRCIRKFYNCSKYEFKKDGLVATVRKFKDIRSPSIVNALVHDYRFYNRELTFPKNMFAVLLQQLWKRRV